MDTVIPGMYLLWGLGHRSPKVGEWCAPSGLRLWSANNQYGVPFARSRAVVLYLATRAIVDGPHLTGGLADIAAMFALPWPVENIEQHFLKVVHTKYACSANICACAPLPCRYEHRIAHRVRYCGDTQQFQLTLADEFILSAQLGMRCPREQVRALLRSDQMAALDLLLWFRWQEHRGIVASVDALGEHGPFRFLKSARSPTRKRDEIVRLHDVVVGVWPECSYRVTPDGNRLIYANPLPSARNGGLFDVVF